MKSKLDLGEVLGKWTQEPAPKAPIRKPVLVTPTFDIPLPPSYPRKEEAITDLKEGVRAAASTATLLNKLGMSEGINTAEEEEGPDVPTGLLDPTGLFQQAFGAESPDVKMAEELTGTGKRGSKKSKKLDGTTSVAPTELFDTYITNRLLEESKCGDTKHEIRALELLGKISDVGLFSEKTEINVTHTTDSLQHAIKDKIGRLMGMVGGDIQDVEFEEVENAEEEDELETIVDEED